jgi:HAD superfamily hydrolase (TIGR01549 family)
VTTAAFEAGIELGSGMTTLVRIAVGQAAGTSCDNEAMRDCAVVVFDWYNTLAAPNPDDFWTRLPELISEAGGAPDEAAVVQWEAGHPLVHHEYSTSEDAYRGWQSRRLGQLLEACQVPEPNRSRLAGDIEHLRYQRLFSVFDDVTETLELLRNGGMRTGICSNWDWCLDRHLQHNEIDSLVDFVVCSAINGHRKPHPGIFQAVIASAGARPDEILFVGDSLVEDIGGAAVAGLLPIHLDRAGACDSKGHHGIPCLSDLRAVASVLGKNDGGTGRYR